MTTFPTCPRSKLFLKRVKSAFPERTRVYNVGAFCSNIVIRVSHGFVNGNGKLLNNNIFILFNQSSCNKTVRNRKRIETFQLSNKALFNPGITYSCYPNRRGGCPGSPFFNRRGVLIEGGVHLDVTERPKKVNKPV